MPAQQRHKKQREELFTRDTESFSLWFADG
jgi:hypothetical protein